MGDAVCIAAMALHACDGSFDLTTIDSSLGNDNNNEEQSLIHGMVSLCKHYLGDPGPTRDAAAVCLSKLLTRPDMEGKYLTEF